MCGIAGIIVKQPQEMAASLGMFKDKLAHRGPDDHGWLVHGLTTERGRGVIPSQPATVGLLHRRLSILDLSESGWQPMSNPDGYLHIVFNGEIYNYIELRLELQAKGKRFKTSSDTEVLLAAYECWGAEMLRKLNGMFAFAILDSKKQEVFIARDYFGIKPLFYTLWRDGFAFASEIAPLLALPGINKTVHPQRLYDYLRFGFTGHAADTMIDSIKQLLPAHYLKISLKSPNEIQPIRYWELEPTLNSSISFDEAKEQMRALFLESVRFHLRSDVPVGAALSGGIDSSAIVAAMRQVQPNLNLHTFSYIADDPKINEEQYVYIAAQAAQANTHLIHLKAEDLNRDLEKLVIGQGEPFGSTSIYAQYRVFQAAKAQGITVMLDGQGADEMLAGYRPYIASRVATLIKSGNIAAAVQLLSRSRSLPNTNAIGLFIRSLEHVIPQSLHGIARKFIGQELVPEWFNRSWFVERNVQLQSAKLPSGAQVLKHDLQDSLERITLPALLRYEDHNSMAHSIESRVPFLTREIAEFAFSLPEHYLVNEQGLGKAVFRDAMRGIVPDQILDRKDKLGFVTPEKQWLLSDSEHYKNLLLENELEQFEPLASQVILTELKNFKNNQKPFNWQVWRWLNVLMWSRYNGITF